MRFDEMTGLKIANVELAFSFIMAGKEVAGGV